MWNPALRRPVRRSVEESETATMKVVCALLAVIQTRGRDPQTFSATSRWDDYRADQEEIHRPGGRGSTAVPRGKGGQTGHP